MRTTRLAATLGLAATLTIVPDDVDAHGLRVAALLDMKRYVRLNADAAKPELEPGIREIMHRLEAGELRPEIEKV